VIGFATGHPCAAPGTGCITRFYDWVQAGVLKRLFEDPVSGSPYESLLVPNRIQTRRSRPGSAYVLLSCHTKLDLRRARSNAGPLPPSEAGCAIPAEVCTDRFFCLGCSLKWPRRDTVAAHPRVQGR
jgi:hypothetical protein